MKLCIYFKATFSVAENQTSIGTVTATDVDTDDSSITFSVSGSELSIGSSSGVLTFNSAPDYETKSSYSATVTASDGANTTNQNIIVNVTDVNDNSPSITSCFLQCCRESDCDRNSDGGCRWRYIELFTIGH